MANILLSPDLLYDASNAGSGSSPPEQWNGTTYSETVGEGVFQDMALSLVSAPSEPYSMAGIFTVSSPDGAGNTLIAYDRDSETEYLSVPVANGESVEFSFDALAGSRAMLTCDARYGISYTLTPTETPPTPIVSYNCECDDDYPRTTLLEMRKRLMRRLGFAVQANNPPPGMADLLTDFIQGAQEMLFRRYSAFRRERYFTWDMLAGVRFYDLDANADECTKKLDPHMVSWVGISKGDDTWRPLVCGIDPVVYTSNMSGIPDHYEIRQCIEVWPPPSDSTWKLRIKGQFGLMPLEADDDETTVDPEAIFQLSLANAKAHYGQPDAGNYAQQLTAYIRDLVRGSHHTARYLPGSADCRNAVRPVPVGGWPENS